MQSTLRKSADPVAAKADLLVVCVADPPEPLTGPAAAVDAALGGLVARAVKDKEIDGKAGSATLFHAAAGLASPRVVVVGLGAAARDDWRSAGAGRGEARRRGEGESVARGPARRSRTRRRHRRARRGLRRWAPTASTASRRPTTRPAAAGAPGGPLPRRPARPTCAAPTAWSRR